MFSNDKKIQNVADAVSKIMMGEKLHPNQQKLDVHEPEKDKLTADDFKKLRAGKKATEVKKEEVEQLKEYESKGGTYKHKGTYGTEKSTEAGYTDYDKENELAKKNLTAKPAKKKYGARQNFVRSTRVNESFSGLIDAYNQNGIKGLFESLNKEEVEQLDELSPGTLKSYVKGAKAEVRDAEDVRDSARAAGDGKTANDMYQLTKKRNAGIKQAKAKLNAEEVEYVEVEVTDLDDVNGVTVQTIDTIDERTLTEPETKKKEEVVKSMKKGLSGFKARYGDDAKSVMYATATKIAKKD
jgi:hypothetical protein